MTLMVAAEAVVTVIQPSRGWSALRLSELWSSRELAYFLVWRDLKVRYKQTVLGVAWAILQPSFATLLFSVVFGRFAGIPSDGLPYPVFAFCALLPWQLFAHALTDASHSLVANQSLMTKVYFPRALLPLASVLTAGVDFALGGIVLGGLMLAYGVAPGPAALSLPGFIVMALGAAFGVGLWLSALNVRYRDVRYTIPFLSQAWFFATPVVYPASLVPEPFRPWLGLNPMAGVVEGFRWALLGAAPPPQAMVALSALVTLLLVIGGLVYFRRTERTFADVV
jgi:lipopolysaccharide transport system permease protein